MERLTETLTEDYARGATSPGLALLVSAQMSFGADTRARVARVESLGGALLEQAPGAEMGEGALDAVLGRLDAEEEEPAPRIDAGPLPEVVMGAVGTDFTRIPWRFRLPGVSEYVLAGFPDEKVSLLRARPGTSIPQHTHEGQEATLVLTGAMEDGGRVFRAGEVAINDESDDHKPRIVGDEICHCLVVMTGELRFTGRFGRALNILAE
jgi:putative transcriptional regulator